MITPVVAASAVEAAGMTIHAGMALGVQQIGRGYAGGTGRAASGQGPGKGAGSYAGARFWPFSRNCHFV